MIDTRKELGNTGESIAAQFLRKIGYKILAQNYRTKHGEVDVIAQKDDVVAFVEVKTRTTTYVPISSVVTPTKQRHIAYTAQHYALTTGIKNKVLRFDIITIQGNGTDHQLNHIPNAFQVRRSR